MDNAIILTVFFHFYPCFLKKHSHNCICKTTFEAILNQCKGNCKQAWMQAKACAPKWLHYCFYTDRDCCCVEERSSKIPQGVNVALAKNDRQ